MTSRMKNPAMIVPGALQGLLAVGGAIKKSNVPALTLHLVNMRASQINGCGFCLDMHAKEAKHDGERDERLWSLAGWREAPWFNAAERAALELTEAVTRINDRGDAVPGDVYARAAEHYDEASLAALILNISMINLWNRLNVATCQTAGTPWR